MLDPLKNWTAPSCLFKKIVLESADGKRAEGRTDRKEQSVVKVKKGKSIC